MPSRSRRRAEGRQLEPEQRAQHLEAIRRIAGTAYYGTTHQTPAHRRRWALGSWGRQRESQRTGAGPRIGCLFAIPAIISPETFAAARARIEHNQRMAKRNNTQHEYFVRGLVSCTRCCFAYTARTVHPGYNYYACAGRRLTRRACQRTSRVRHPTYLPAPWIKSSGTTSRASSASPYSSHKNWPGHRLVTWLPEALQAHHGPPCNAVLHSSHASSSAYSTSSSPRVIARRRSRTQAAGGLSQLQNGLSTAGTRIGPAGPAANGRWPGSPPASKSFCQRIQPTLEQLAFAQRKRLVELLIDRIIVDEHQSGFATPYPPATRELCSLL